MQWTTCQTRCRCAREAITSHQSQRSINISFSTSEVLAFDFTFTFIFISTFTVAQKCCLISTMRIEQNGWYFADDIVKWLLLTENVINFNRISLTDGENGNLPALVHAMNGMVPIRRQNLEQKQWLTPFTGAYRRHKEIRSFHLNNPARTKKS